MITPKEVRLGNYVMDNVSGEWMIIEEIKRSNILGAVINSHKYPLPDGWQMAGIQITPEILLKCGFEKLELNEGGYYYSLLLNKLNLELASSDKNGFLEVCIFPYEGYFRYRYLHQLQNLWHILKGEELEVNLIEQSVK